jgi:hypothetical protein
MAKPSRRRLGYILTSHMSDLYEIEVSEPSVSHCDCCDGLTVRVTGFVCRQGEAFAIYYAEYSNIHPENEIALLVSIGEWGEESVPSQRAAFYCRVRPVDDSHQVTLGDVADSPWSDVELIGQKLTRAEALAHPLKTTAFELVDAACDEDVSLKGFLQRANCGDPSEPLERSFGAPDEIFALGDDQKARAELGRSFACLDGERFFVRCLLPLQVESYGPWCVGVSIEVSKADYTHVRAVWDDPELYPTLRFAGVAANDLSEELDLPLKLGSQVQLHVTDPDTPPRIESPNAGALAKRISQTWAKAEFESYAIKRGFL